MGDKKSLDISILGSGIAGLASAIGLARLPSKPQITVYEVRSEPATIGGAVNLTPNALRILHQLGVLEVIKERRYGASIETIQIFDLYTAAHFGVINFKGKDGNGHGKPPFKALRIMRGELLEALLGTAAKFPNIAIKYGRRATGITETESAVTITFSDDIVSTDILLGCDGIHSAVRSLLVDPDREPIYSGIAVAFAFSPIDPKEAGKFFFKDTTVVTSRRGSFMASFFNATRDALYIGGVMEKEHIDSREGWKAKGGDQEQVRKDIGERFNGSVIKDLDGLIRNAGDWYLYPVFKLGPSGKWASSRVMLLGDAAHAMPPQGESTGIALEDTVVFTRLIGLYPKYEMSVLFAQYEKLRRSRVDAAYKDASFRWETVKDSGWFAHKLKCMLVPWFLWFTENKRAESFEEDTNALYLGLC
jgi:salicylate hydroxylase